MATDHEDIRTILRALERLALGEITVEQLLELNGGRQWYLPTVLSYRRARRYRAIVSFPSRDYKVVARHFGVSFGVVYRAWGSGIAS